MEKRNLKIVCAILVLFVCRLQADTNWTTGHHEIYNDDTYGEIWMYNDCTLDILGGVIGRLAVYDITVTNWYDGYMNTLWARGSSIVNIYGGQLIFFSAIDNSLVNLYAYDVTHTDTGGIYDLGQVMGKYLLDDTMFSFSLGGQQSLLHLNIVPEPTTLILLVLGGLIIKRK